MEISFTRLSGNYGIARLPANTPIPDWADGEGLVSITRAEDELSIVCLADRMPVNADTGWSALKVENLAELDEPGVVMAAITPISQAGLGVFVMSTHLRDYILVRTHEIARVQTALTNAGHTFR